MKSISIFLLGFILFATSCNENKTESKESTTTAAAVDNEAGAYPSVTAKISGKDWKSIPGEVLATYDQFDDKLQIFTKDEAGKMNFLLSMSPFTKTNAGAYSSKHDGAGGFGISLLDETPNDADVNDYDNFHQGAIENCLTISSIKEVPEGKVITGTFASPMNVSNNYDQNKDKGVTVTDGKFAVLLKK